MVNIFVLSEKKKKSHVTLKDLDHNFNKNGKYFCFETKKKIANLDHAYTPIQILYTYMNFYTVLKNHFLFMYTLIRRERILRDICCY